MTTAVAIFLLEAVELAGAEAFARELLHSFHGYLLASFQFLLDLIPNIIVAGLVLSLSLFLAPRVSNFLCNRLGRRVQHEALLMFLGSLARLLIGFVGVILTLSILGFDRAVTSLLAGVGILSIGFGFAMKTLLSNMIAGIVIIFSQPIREGDIIEVEGCLGTVQRIGIRSTYILSFAGIEYLIPNSYMLSTQLLNYTMIKRRRLEVDFRISKALDLKLVEESIYETLSKLPDLLPGKSPHVYFQCFGQGSIEVTCHLWVIYPGDNNYLKTRHSAVIALHELFQRSGWCLPKRPLSLDIDPTLITSIEAPRCE